MSKRHLRDLTNASLLERRGVPKVICLTTQMQKVLIIAFITGYRSRFSAV